MAYHEIKGARLMNILYGKRFNLWKFKMEMLLDSIHLWVIIEKFKKALTSNMDVAFEVSSSKTCRGWGLSYGQSSHQGCGPRLHSIPLSIWLLQKHVFVTNMDTSPSKDSTPRAQIQTCEFAWTKPLSHLHGSKCFGIC